MAILAYYEKDEEPEVTILDILKIPDAYTGRQLTKEFNDCLETFGVNEKVSQMDYTWLITKRTYVDARDHRRQCDE